MDSLGQVVELTLAQNQLAGSIPPELGNLASLRKLYLYENNLTGSIPPELGSLAELQQLRLSENNLTGSIPPELGNLAGLKSLQFHKNRLTGSIPPELGNLASLRKLYLSINNLTGSIPPELGNLASLETLALYTNRLTGSIPPELGNLAELEGLLLAQNQLAGSIPPELGNLAGLKSLQFHDNRLTGSIPPELGSLAELQQLQLSENNLTGSIPRELENLASLRTLTLSWNNLTGTIPPELENLAGLRDLYLHGNGYRHRIGLTGSIPPELGNLDSLRVLSLHTNGLTGTIPPELGSLAELKLLLLYENNLTGTIPAELASLAELESLEFDQNDLTGTIPAELGDLAELKRLLLYENNLTGTIPAELGDLAELEWLHLGGNELTSLVPPELGNLSELQGLFLSKNNLAGPIPPELGNLRGLQYLHLFQNVGLAGVLPDSLTKLEMLEAFLAGETALCAPLGTGFQTWLEGIPLSRVRRCTPSAAYVTQAVQSRDYPVPLVAEEKSLLRAFVTATNPGKATMPRVIARFYRDDRRVYEVEIPATSHPIPKKVDESSLKASANAEIPANVVKPGLQLVVEVDPEDTLDDSVGVVKRIPAEGRLAIEVQRAPLFDLTVVPFLYTEDPDSSLIALVKAMAADPQNHRLLQQTADLQPVGDMRVTAHAPVETGSNSGFRVLHETLAIRVLEGGTGHYMGMLPIFSDVAGVAWLRGRVSASIPSSTTIAHELGHNFSSRHAPCGTRTAVGVDPNYPDPDGFIGAWGYAIRTVKNSRGKGFSKGQLVPDIIPDIMSYCRDPEWIGEYHFTKAFRFRLHDEDGEERRRVAEHALLLWGGVSSTGALYLEPAFVVNAPPTLPEATGDYKLEGRDAGDRVLFSLAFRMPQIADAGKGAGGFVYALPARPEWEGRLASITLSGPGGTVTLDGDTDSPMAILRDRRTGQVRALLRGKRAQGDPVHWLAGSRFEVFLTRGIPAADAWK